MFEYSITYVKKLTNSKGASLRGHCDVKPFRLSAELLIDYYSKGNDGLIAHEVEHYIQHLKTLTMLPFLYKLSKKFRLWAEIAAYKKQLEYSTDKEEDEFEFAVYLSRCYDLDISSLDAYNILTG